MLGSTYGHGILRDYVVAFGTIFNDVSVIRTSDLAATTYVRVPLSYAPQERFLARLNQNPTLSRQEQITLPRMSFEMTTMNYAGERKLNTVNKIRKFTSTSNGTHISSMFSPVPYDVGFSLHVYSRNTEDASNIVEQILPFFTPEFTLTIKSVTDFNIPMDIPIILNSISKEDTYEGGFEDRRVLVWTLDITLKGMLYGPIKESGGLIKKAYIEFYTPSQYSVETANARSTNSSSVSHIRLANTASISDDYYVGATINITSGTSTGATGVHRRITSYVGASQTANVFPVFSSAPDTTSTYRLEFNIPDSEYNAGDILAGPQNAAKLASRVMLKPGMSATGMPISGDGGSYTGVDIQYIDANDDYGVIETTTFFDSSIRRNLITGVDERDD